MINAEVHQAKDDSASIVIDGRKATKGDQVTIIVVRPDSKDGESIAISLKYAGHAWILDAYNKGEESFRRGQLCITQHGYIGVRGDADQLGIFHD